ncbi:3-demethylubiquinone-9 3-methyltransferase [Microdochium bolleyi]|uniref:3-demethylubiquinone-9 3-methyltransferase n=1 Tax=Microdochium bolleyi TaxID=196109 RepID=A0A136JAX6_9PEZI|nr:3-demethylubiquinone-9 3-methyltransferase [Microdochium bolleyi]
MPVTTLTTCLWFDGQAEEAARFYTGIFKDSRIITNLAYTDAGSDTHGQKPGSVMIVEWEMLGQRFVGLNGGPMFKHSEAVSFQIDCDTQEELDRYWDQLGAGGDASRQQCGWLADKFGVAWQVVPAVLKSYMASGDQGGAARVTEAMMKMKKMDIEALDAAFRGQ